MSPLLGVDSSTVLTAPKGQQSDGKLPISKGFTLLSISHKWGKATRHRGKNDRYSLLAKRMFCQGEGRGSSVGFLIKKKGKEKGKIVGRVASL